MHALRGLHPHGRTAVLESEEVVLQQHTGVRQRIAFAVVALAQQGRLVHQAQGREGEGADVQVRVRYPLRLQHTVIVLRAGLHAHGVGHFHGQ